MEKAQLIAAGHKSDVQKNPWLSLPVILTAPLLSVLDVFIVNMAIPSIKADLKATRADLEFAGATSRKITQAIKRAVVLLHFVSLLG